MSSIRPTLGTGTCDDGLPAALAIAEPLNRSQDSDIRTGIGNHWNDLLPIDSLELSETFVKRDVFGIAVGEYQHRPSTVGSKEFGDAPSSFPKFRFEYLHVWVEPVHCPLNDRNKDPIRSSVRHHGIRELSTHLADPNSRSSCVKSGLTREPPMKSATACRSKGWVIDFVSL